MTKLHEEFIRGRLSQILEILKARPSIKGECTLLIAGRDENREAQWETVRMQIRDQLSSSGESVAGLSKKFSQKYGLSKNKVYREALDIRRQMTENRGPKTEDR